MKPRGTPVLTYLISLNLSDMFPAISGLVKKFNTVGDVLFYGYFQGYLLT